MIVLLVVLLYFDLLSVVYFGIYCLFVPFIFLSNYLSTIRDDNDNDANSVLNCT